MEVFIWIIIKIKNKLSFFKEFFCFILLYYRNNFFLEKMIKIEIYLYYNLFELLIF